VPSAQINRVPISIFSFNTAIKAVNLIIGDFLKH
jgi:hypothetical protein